MLPCQKGLRMDQSNFSQQAKGIISEVQASAAAALSIDDLAQASIIPQGIEVPKPEIVFAMGDVPMFTKKSVSTLIGKAKSGKTTCTAWIVAQIITGSLNVLWVDTEQGEYYGSRTQHWILNIAQIDKSPNLTYADLKEFNPDVRYKIVESLIVSIKPDLVIIDGIRDLVFDINQMEQATIIVGGLMRLATLHDCHILSILHQNKGNEHARGHLGTEMINKSESVIKVSMTDSRITVCEPEFTRGEPFKPFAFDRDAYGRPIIVDYIPQISTGEANSTKRTSLPIDISKETHFELLERAFADNDTMTYGNLLLAIGYSFEYYGMKMGVNKRKDFLQFYTSQRFVTKVEATSGTGNKSFYQINFALKGTIKEELVSPAKTKAIISLFSNRDDEIDEREPPF
jgi:hypothetical protein